MRDVLISIKPQYCSLIASGQKTVEIRKNKPAGRTPFRVLVYCTNPHAKEPDQILETHVDGKIHRCNGKVIGEFICKETFPIYVYPDKAVKYWLLEHMEDAQVPYDVLADYIGADKTGYGWRISDFRLYDKPKELAEFQNLIGKTIKRPPQSWCYVREG